jgi:hypothetical protein
LAALDPGSLALKRLERVNPGKIDLVADFGDFQTGDYGWLPRRFDVQSLKGGWRTQVKITKIELNPFLVEKNFKLDADFSAKIEECR